MPLDLQSQDITNAAENHIRDILSSAIQYSDSQNAVIVADAQSPLSVILAEAYRRCIPKAKFVDFDAVSPEAVLESFKSLSASDLVVLIQSTNFRLEAFRLRVELFSRGLKVIEHVHLGRMLGDEVKYYVDSLDYDANYYRGVGNALKLRIDKASSALVDSGGEQLMFSSGFEDAKLNVGDYSNIKNIGGQFPIGEVFTEARDLESVNGRVRIAVFGDTVFSVNKPPKPITLVISKGRVTDAIDATEEFEKVLSNIRADESEVWVREFGFGLNRAFTPQRTVSDIGTYERMCGVHLSLGAKHTIYKKPNFTRKNARHQVDVFAITEFVKLDDEVVYQNGAWVVGYDT